MATIYSRCFALYKQQKIDEIPSHDQMMEIGLVVIKKYREETKGKEPIKVQMDQRIGNFMVAYYPAFFLPKLIHRSCISCVEEKKREKRNHLTIMSALKECRCSICISEKCLSHR